MQFEGYGESLFSRDPYDKDDEEADKIYNMVDSRQDERRKDHRHMSRAEETIRLSAARFGHAVEMTKENPIPFQPHRIAFESPAVERADRAHVAIEV